MRIEIFKKVIENSTDELELENSVNLFMKDVTVKDVKMSFTSKSGELYLVVAILYEPKEETI